MPQHSYKQLEEAYQRVVNKEHKPNPARTHPMSFRQGKGHLEMPINQTEPAQYSQDSQSDSNHEFDITTVNPNVKAQGWTAPTATLKTATCHAIQGQQYGPARTSWSAWRSTGPVHRA